MEPKQNHPRGQRREGQTLIEFAITLPILLVLIFGIVEFGRIFQAWISIQNSAREAARYASTGAYLNEFDAFINPDSLRSGEDDSDSIVPCVSSGSPGLPRNIYSPIFGDTGSYLVEVHENAFAATAGERIFNTWWGKDCEPQGTDLQGGFSGAGRDQALRTDLVRIPSVYKTAMDAIGGLQTDVIPIEQMYAGTAAEAEQRLWNFLRSTWNPVFPQFDPPCAGNATNLLLPDTNTDSMTMGFGDGYIGSPVPGGPGFNGYTSQCDPGTNRAPAEYLRGYVSVMMCSSRLIDDRIDGDYDAYLQLGAPPPEENEPEQSENYRRFITVYDPVETRDDLLATFPDKAAEINALMDPLLNEGEDLYNPYTDMPTCFSNMKPEAGGQGLNNAGVRWLDAGGPRDRVDVAVSFYHPLITPLGLAQFIPMHARRSAFVESFRTVTGQVASAQDGGNATGNQTGGGIEETDEPTEEVTEEPTPSFTPSPTDVPPTEISPTAKPFDCSLITFEIVDTSQEGDDRFISFQPGQVVFVIRNENDVPAVFRRVDFHWSRPAYDADSSVLPVPNAPGFAIDRMTVDGGTLWDGNDSGPETDTDQDVGFATDVIRQIEPGETSTFAVTYTNAPSNILSDDIPRSSFSGTNFYFSEEGSTGVVDCTDLEFTSDNDEVPNDPDRVIDPPVDCVSGSIEFGAAANAFQESGWVQFFVTNRRDIPAPIRGFQIQWGAWEDRAESGEVLLEGVYLGGGTPLEGTPLWQTTGGGVGITSTTSNEGTLTDPNIYDPVTPADGQTFNNPLGIIPANTTVNLWLDFNGNNLQTGGRDFLLSDFTFWEYDENNDSFNYSEENSTRIIIGCDPNGDGNNGTGGDTNTGTTGIINEPPPQPTFDPSNDPPKAQADVYSGINPNQNFTVGANNGVLVNDTDCQDDTPARGTSGGGVDGQFPICSDQNNNGSLDPNEITNNGDNIRVSSCLNGCEATGDGLTVPLDLDPDGNIELDLLNSDGQLDVDDICEATSPISVSYNYSIEDAREGQASARVTFNINNPSNPNQRPERRNREQVYGPITGGESVSGDLDNHLVDPDGDNLTFAFDALQNNDLGFPNSAINLNNNNGTWTFTADRQYTDRIPEGETERLFFKFTADDGQGICSDEDNRITILVEGTGDRNDPTAVPTNTPLPDEGGNPDLGGSG